MGRFLRLDVIKALYFIRVQSDAINILRLFRGIRSLPVLEIKVCIGVYTFQMPIEWLDLFESESEFDAALFV